MHTLYLSRYCPHSRNLTQLLEKKMYRPIPLRIQIQEVEAQGPPIEEGIEYTPTLITAEGQRFEGQAAISWITNVARLMGLPQRDAQYHAGNKRFVIAVLLLILLVRISCEN